MEGLAVGEYMVTEVEGDLALIGEPLPVYLDMFIMRTADDQVIATSNSMLFISTEELGIDAGIDVLCVSCSTPTHKTGTAMLTTSSARKGVAVRLLCGGAAPTPKIFQRIS